MNPKPSSIEEYFSWFSPEIQEKLQLIRETLLKAVPEGKEVISYHMPAIKTSEVLVYYAAQKNHIGYYPTNQPIIEFKKELSGYVTSKGAIQIPYDQELPLKLISDIAIFRREQAILAAEQKQKKKKKS
ncbi:uncharacterized protein YdhG (YjbR/CyaY superfamily) [Algoriphagus iocasae]|jgi:uncharacterized protein YdhG (YjbR/CyaY superfamily)|uniref:Uncharacterized protein YdhG (YjbR/CyaY superfamily) n=1 Tax=Algoriphagus iocasae TaxID=1836499 RepID=A0A841MLM5_9BACT|nr:DUF1801 domain-containing protein [Algoriphagus iocasae]MBB6325146.1 uncharacterized protein YdhG (YjbR/CyaY superfamily) [Algoriphagus iocasae]